MSLPRFTSVATMVLLATVAGVAPATAQGDSAPFRVGSLGLSPTIRVTNVGWDSNVYNVSVDPPSDVTAVFNPVVDASMQSPRFTLSGHSGWNYYYFRRLSSLRALDMDQSGRVETTLNRVSPYVSGSWMSTSHRQNLEIDAIVRRQDHNVEAGAYLRLSGKTFVGLYGGHSAVDYEGDATFRATELATSLNHSTVHGAVDFRYRATPLTTFAVTVTRARDRFESSPGRDAESTKIGPSVEFKPLALISGTASVAYQKVTFRDARQPDFSSTVASANLQYTLQGRTQFAVRLQRSLEYSYLETQTYVAAGITTTVTHHLNNQWDVVGILGRYGLNYRTQVAAPPVQTFVEYGTSIGYRLGRHRIAFDLDHSSRSADFFAHEYSRLRIGSSLTYVF